VTNSQKNINANALVSCYQKRWMNFGEVISDEAVFALELLQETAVSSTCCQISIDAIAGTETPNTVRIQAHVGDKAMILLIDCGSSNTFVNKVFTKKSAAQYLQHLLCQLRWRMDS
jgi:hypothetical protein